ncbi:LysR substrate-binding domain-containing protein [Streptomyces noursei]|uniref:LysR substrate-binding domain-containing protein n=1 Tax=Streptomyces noursei TaxID=1971 RepID=UPI0030F0E498
MDVALVWLPVPNQDTFNIQVLVWEPRWVAVRKDHRLADSREVAFAELVHEPFLALPGTAGLTLIGGRKLLSRQVRHAAAQQERTTSRSL